MNRRTFDDRRIRSVLAAALLAWPCVSPPRADAGPAAVSPFCAESGSYPTRVAAGPDGSTFVAGITFWTGLPASLPAPESEKGWFYVTALAADGAPRWTAYLPSTADMREVSALCVSPDGSVWCGGVGEVPEVSPPPALCGTPRDGWNGWFAKVSKDGEVVTAATIGGGGDDWVTDIAVDPQGRAVIVGVGGDSQFACDAPGFAQPAFALRVRADGTAYDWARQVGEADCAGVAIGADGAPVVTCSGAGDRPPVPGATRLAKPRRARAGRGVPNDPRTLCVARLGDGGEVVRSVSLDFAGDGSGPFNGWLHAAPVAVDPDGAVVVAGSRSVVRLSAALDRVEAVAAAPRAVTVPRARRVGIDASGRVIVNWDVIDMRRFPDSGRVDVFSRGLRPAGVAWPIPGATADLAAGPHAAVHVVCDGGGLRFREPAELVGAGGLVVCRVPLDGVASPSRLVATVSPSGAIELAWPRDGDAAASLEVERTEFIDGSPFTTQAIATLPPDARSFSDAALRPGTTYQYRLVSEFASGARTAVRSRRLTTPPVAPAGVEASPSSQQTATVTWDGRGALGGMFLVQRRVGSGPWQEVAEIPASQFAGQIVSFSERVPDTLRPLLYRVAHATDASRSAWTVASPIRSVPTLLVRQATGSLAVQPSQAAQISVTARLRPADPAASLEFSQASQPLTFFVGNSLLPFGFTIPANDPGWARVGNRFEWYAPPDDFSFPQAPAVVLDLDRGTFEATVAAFSTSANPIEVGLSFGDLHGSDLREWTRVAKSPLRLELR